METSAYAVEKGLEYIFHLCTWKMRAQRYALDMPNVFFSRHIFKSLKDTLLYIC